MVGHPAYFRHDEKDVDIVIHIDDSIIAGPPAQMAEIKQRLQGKVFMKDWAALTNTARSISARSRRPREVSDSLRRLAWIRESHLPHLNERDETHG